MKKIRGNSYHFLQNTFKIQKNNIYIKILYKYFKKNIKIKIINYYFSVYKNFIYKIF